MEVVAPKSKVFHESLEASPVFDASVEFIWRREDCVGMTGLEYKALQLKIALK